MSEDFRNSSCPKNATATER